MGHPSRPPTAEKDRREWQGKILPLDLVPRLDMRKGAWGVLEMLLSNSYKGVYRQWLNGDGKSGYK